MDFLVDCDHCELKATLSLFLMVRLTSDLVWDPHSSLSGIYA